MANLHTVTHGKFTSVEHDKFYFYFSIAKKVPYVDGKFLPFFRRSCDFFPHEPFSCAICDLFWPWHFLLYKDDGNFLFESIGYFSGILFFIFYLSWQIYFSIIPIYFRVWQILAFIIHRQKWAYFGHSFFSPNWAAKMTVRIFFIFLKKVWFFWFSNFWII